MFRLNYQDNSVEFPDKLADLFMEFLEKYSCLEEWECTEEKTEYIRLGDLCELVFEYMPCAN